MAVKIRLKNRFFSISTWTCMLCTWSDRFLNSESNDVTIKLILGWIWSKTVGYSIWKHFSATGHSRLSTKMSTFLPRDSRTLRKISTFSKLNYKNVDFSKHSRLEFLVQWSSSKFNTNVNDGPRSTVRRTNKTDFSDIFYKKM